MTNTMTTAETSKLVKRLLIDGTGDTTDCFILQVRLV